MNVSYIVPEGSYEFFRELVPKLESLGRCDVNRIRGDTDVILCGILPLTHGWIRAIREGGKPFIIWHWDMYSFTDYCEPRWSEYLRILPMASEVWSCSYETARQLKERMGLESRVVTAWINPTLTVPRPSEPYVFYATGGNSIGKRLDWARRACNLLEVRLRTTPNQGMSREEYFDVLSKCRVYLCTAFEESNGSIPAMEAAACGKPVVMADTPGNREAFGDEAFYFGNHDFRSLLRALEEAWRGKPVPGCRSRILRLFDFDKVAASAVEGLRHVWEVHQRGSSGTSTGVSGTGPR